MFLFIVKHDLVFEPRIYFVFLIRSYFIDVARVSTINSIGTRRHSNTS